MMRRVSIAALLGLCAWLPGAGVLAEAPAEAKEPDSKSPVGPAPHIVFDSVLLNLGDIVHGQDAVATFAFRNTGDVPLHVLSAKPG